MRYLVVANQTLGGSALSTILRSHADEGAKIYIVVPATEPADRARGEKVGHDDAAQRLETELERLRTAGIPASGSVGAADPMTAVREAMAAETYEGIIIATLPAGVSRWLRVDLPRRVEREFRLPVEWIEAHGDDANEPTTINLDLPRVPGRARSGGYWIDRGLR